MIALLMVLALAQVQPREGGRHDARVGGRTSNSGASCAPVAAIVDGDWLDLAGGGAATVTRTVGYEAGCGGAWERLQPTDTGASQYSSVANFNVPTCNPVSYGCCVKGTHGLGATDLAHFTGAWHTATISYTTAATWFSAQNQLGTGLDRYAIGNLSAVNGGTTRAGVDFEVKGCSIVCGATIAPVTCD